MGFVLEPLAARAPIAVAAVLIAGLLFRFIRWAAEFVCSRLDNRADRIDAREKAVERRMNKRLEHVERELNAYRRLTMLLFNVVAENIPAHPALVEVATIMQSTWQFEEPDPELDGLINRLRNQPFKRGSGNEATA